MTKSIYKTHSVRKFLTKLKKLLKINHTESLQNIKIFKRRKTWAERSNEASKEFGKEFVKSLNRAVLEEDAREKKLKREKLTP